MPANVGARPEDRPLNPYVSGMSGMAVSLEALWGLKAVLRSKLKLYLLEVGVVGSDGN